MRHYDIFDMHECFKCPSWRRLFEQPKLLQGWISFQLWTVHGYRSKEMALFAVYAARFLCGVYRRNGPLYVARYMKTCRVVMYKCLGGLSKDSPPRVLYPVSYEPSSKMVPVSLTRSGLPRFILRRHRRIMMTGMDREKWVRTYSTVLDLYKLIVLPVQVDVSSIIEEATMPPLSLPRGPLVDPVRSLAYANRHTRLYLRDTPLELGFAPKLMWTAGPNTPPGLGSLAMLVEDAQAFLDKHINLELHLLDCLFLPSERMAGRGPYDPPVLTRALERFLVQVVAPRPPDRLDLTLGRVGVKVEPAGKTRLFMIMDSITQRLLAPLHKWVFGLLRLIPSDGTFAQTAPLELLKGTDSLYSFDLKSATDRVPAEECLSLLSSLFGDSVAIAWRCLLYRPFQVPATLDVTPKVPDVIFTTGTPLGSLSSWGVFALFHHLMVQQAAYFCNRKRPWFSKYAILGDDLVIGCPDVARQYRRMLRRIGVKISSEKSVASRNGSMEFASRFIYRGVDVSPISFRSLAAARVAPGVMAGFFARLEQFREVRFSEFLRVQGAGYRILPLSSMPYGRLARLPKRWFRLWLVYHHPRGRHSLPWVWWLSAGRGFIIPPTAIGVLHHQLWDDWIRQPEWLCDDTGFDSCPYWEEVVRAPWLLMQLRNLKDTCLALIQGELIDPILDYYPVKRDLSRQPSSEGSSLAVRKWSLSYRLYDRMTRILAKPLPLEIGSSGGGGVP